MFFSTKTIALVAASGLLAAQGGSAIALEERSTSLCNQPNYGAPVAPWKPDSTPGAFCSKTKPNNNKFWRQIPFWDGGDKVRCSGSQRGRYNVCNGGNKKTRLPWGCNPPHRHRPQPPKPSPAKPCTTTSAAASPAASSAVASSAVSSAAASPSDAASSAASSDAGTATSSAAPATNTDVVDPDPTSDPVCELSYQVQYTNYTLVAPNGVWTGMTVGAATQDASYMTYTLATSVDDCLNACDQIEGCVFVNTYIDRNDQEAYLPKHTPGMITCAMFSQCVGTDKNNNWGGQDDPNDILNSNGYCKSGACSS
ncbi:hypothetical protein IAU60_000127 [Kwoniella sp. DSM 27419]